MVFYKYMTSYLLQHSSQVWTPNSPLVICCLAESCSLVQSRILDLHHKSPLLLFFTWTDDKAVLLTAQIKSPGIVFHSFFSHTSHSQVVCNFWTSLESKYLHIQNLHFSPSYSLPHWPRNHHCFQVSQLKFLPLCHSAFHPAPASVYCQNNRVVLL